ncbi:MAG: hypothetical protein, partial [Olavius algarvensis Delta 4 endosymbiont]
VLKSSMVCLLSNFLRHAGLDPASRNLCDCNDAGSRIESGM